MTTQRSTIPSTLQTPRLRLRAPVQADAGRIAMFIGKWEVARMLSRVPYPYTEADAISWIADPGSEPHRYALVHANGVVGAVGLGVLGEASGALELGYWLAQPFWGRGLMTEAAGAVIAALRASDPSVRITCSHFADNVGSRRVIEKLGFVRTGDRRIACLSRGTDVHAIEYSLPVAASADRPVSELTPA
jgi:[ribosomal protein S5]-alanine N-acetyltransferase